MEMVKTDELPPLKHIRAQYTPDLNDVQFAKGSDNTEIVLESECYFKADVDQYVAKLNGRIHELEHTLNVWTTYQHLASTLKSLHEKKASLYRMRVAMASMYKAINEDYGDWKKAEFWNNVAEYWLERLNRHLVSDRPVILPGKAVTMPHPKHLRGG